MKKEMILSFAVLIMAGIAMAQPKDSAASASVTIANIQNDSVSENAKKELAEVSEKVGLLKGTVTGLNESYLETQAIVDALKKIKVSGYIQAQYQVADVGGVLSLNSAKNGNVRQAFLIKRGRLKTTYDAGLSKYALEIDVTQDGVGIKDAYASFTEPWLKAFSFTAGAMDRPFGYEVSYSSSMLESPERARVIGNLFPKEKDLGAMLEFNQEEGVLSFLNAKVGVYNGGSNVINEYDSYKDVIGRGGLKFGSQELGLAVEGGVSGYAGKVTNVDADTTGGTGKMYVMSGTTWSKTSGHKNELIPRTYYGFDLQLFYATPVIGGTCLKGEYVAGKHPTGTGATGMSGAADFYGNLGTSAAYLASGPMYNREISGFYAYLIQNIDPINAQIVVKYDMWNPNTKVKTDDFTDASTVKSATNQFPLTNNDLTISTIGFGLLYYVPWAPNVRLMGFYELPSYEKLNDAKVSKASGLYKYTQKPSGANGTDLNMLTLRVQYKF